MPTALQQARSPRTTERELYELLDWAEFCKVTYRPLSLQQSAGLIELTRAAKKSLERIICNGQ